MRRNQRSAEAEQWRRWYWTKRWRLLKQQAHTRDGFQCRMCDRLHPTGRHLVADHIREHKGDPELFWSLDNVQSLCDAPCHNRHKQRQERGQVRQTDEDGWPVDRRYASTQ